MSHSTYLPWAKGGIALEFSSPAQEAWSESLLETVAWSKDTNPKPRLPCGPFAQALELGIFAVGIQKLAASPTPRHRSLNEAGV